MELTATERAYLYWFEGNEERVLYQTAYVKPKYGVHDFCSDSENVLKTVLLRGLNFRADSLFLRSLVKRIMFLARKWEFRERSENALHEQLRIAASFSGPFGAREKKKAITIELAHVFAEFRMLTPSRRTGDAVMTDTTFAQTLRIRHALKLAKKFRNMEKQSRMVEAIRKAEQKRALEMRPIIAEVKGAGERVRSANAGWYGGNVSGTASKFRNSHYGGGY